MSRRVQVGWRLRVRMAESGVNTLVGLHHRLSTHGVKVSQVQLGRWAKQPPARLSLKVLVGLCEALDCTLNDLLTITPVEAPMMPEPLAPRAPAARMRKPKVSAVAAESVEPLTPAPAPALPPSINQTVGPTLRALPRHALAKASS